MADTVNLQKSEYDTVIEKLGTLHEAALDGIDKLSTHIRELSEQDGGFYIEKISEKISVLLDTLDTGIMASASTNMQNSEESMDSFAQIILNVDSACDI